jgi:hypothetical protein
MESKNLLENRAQRDTYKCAILSSLSMKNQLPQETEMI